MSLIRLSSVAGDVTVQTKFGGFIRRTGRMARTHQKGGLAQLDEASLRLDLQRIGGQLLHGIECIGVRDFLASANLPKCVSDVPTQKGILELQNVSRRYTSVMASTLRGIVHLRDIELVGGDVPVPKAPSS